jgi:hypothetical protein
MRFLHPLTSVLSVVNTKEVYDFPEYQTSLPPGTSIRDEATKRTLQVFAYLRELNKRKGKEPGNASYSFYDIPEYSDDLNKPGFFEQIKGGLSYLKGLLPR